MCPIVKNLRSIHAARAKAAAVGFSVLILTGAAGLPIATPALAQSRAVFTDDSVTARDALTRAGELARDGSPGEAARTIQRLLDTEAERLVPSADDPLLFVPVRDLVHDVLRRTPTLLDRYIAAEEPQARRLLDSGALDDAERTRLFTPSGLEAALRLTQLHIEAARLDAALLVLEQLLDHPVRGTRAPDGLFLPGPAARDAAEVAALLTRFSTSPRALELARRFALDAGLEPPAQAGAPLPLAEPRSPLDPSPAITLDALPQAALQTLPLRGSPEEADRFFEQSPYATAGIRGMSWIAPTLLGDRLYVNTGDRVLARDARTLAPVWEFSPAPPRSGDAFDDDGLQFLPGIGRVTEDLGWVVATPRIVLACTGLPVNGTRSGDPRVHALDPATGAPLWSVNPATLDPRLRDTFVRGPATIAGDVAVLGLRRPGAFRRETNLYFVGLDLYTGELRWVRYVGGVGAVMWGRSQSRPDAAVLHEGIVYRGDEMGLLAAYEAASGRPRFVRLLATPRLTDRQTRGVDAQPPTRTVAPLLHPSSESVFVVEPSAGDILRINVRSGALLASRTSTDMGGPRYLLSLADRLILVNDTGVGVIAFDQFQGGEPRFTEPLTPNTLPGRVVIAGDVLLIPTEGQLVALDPLRPDQPRKLDLAAAGFVAGSGDHLIAIDAEHLRAFIRWPAARAVLQARVDADPSNPAPLLDFAELARTAGEAALIPDLADRALALLPAAANREPQRLRLVSLLSSILTQARRADLAAAPPSTEPSDTPAPTEPPVIRDATLLSSLVDRLGRAADSPAEQVAYLFELAHLRERAQDTAAAVEAYQRILLDDALALAPFTADDSALQRAGLALDDAPDADPSTLTTVLASTTGGVEAARRLWRAVELGGVPVYAAFDREAAAQAESLAPDASAETIEALAQRYPAAAVTPSLWLKAADAHTRAQSAEEAGLALGQALDAAIRGERLGRPALREVALDAAGRLLALARQSDQVEPAYRLLRRISRLYAEGQVNFRDSRTTVAQAAATLADELARRTDPPRVGLAITGDIQILEGWTPLEPLAGDLPGATRASVVMHSEAAGRVALFARQAGSANLTPAWTRGTTSPLPPQVLAALVDQTLLFWPSREGGEVEAIDATTGRTLWRYAAPAAQLRPGETSRFATPMDGQVRPTDLLVALDGGSTLVLVRRSGDAVALDLATGAERWRTQLPQRRVYDIEALPGVLAVAGALAPEAIGRAPAPSFTLHNLTTGAAIGSVEASLLGDHIRFVRTLAPAEDEPVSLLLATGDALLRIDPTSARVLWRSPLRPDRAAIAAWRVGKSAILLDGSLRAWLVSLTDGKVLEQELATRNRINYPVQGLTLDSRLALCSHRGLLLLDAQGSIVGADAFGGEDRLLPPVPAHTLFITAETLLPQSVAEQNDPFATVRVHALDAASGRLAATATIRAPDAARAVAVIDGRILITTGPATLVLPAPAPND